MPDDRKIIIAGAGRVGGLVARILRTAGEETTVIDYNAKRLEILAHFGSKHFYGDATRADLLKAAGIDQAKVLVIAIDDRDGATELARHVVEMHPNIHVIARAVDRDHVYDLWLAGCRDIIRETYDSTMRMGRSVFEAMGHNRELAQDLVDVFDEADRNAMVTVADAHKPGVAPHENDEYLQVVRENLPIWEEETRTKMAKIMKQKKKKSKA